MSKATIEEFVSRMFEIRNAAHLAHFATGSFSQHMALGDFYETVIGKVDRIVEAYQGIYGLIGTVQVRAYPKGFALEQIDGHRRWLEESRDSIARGSNVIGNLIDDLGADFAVACYKLKQLK